MNLAPSAALARTLTSVAFAAGLAACGGGGTSSVPVVPVTQPVVTPPVIPAPPVVPAAPATYLLGGTVSGMADGATITIVNGADSVTLAGNGSYSLPSRLLTNASYGVSSSTPAGHLCRINDGAGMVGTADVLKIDIKCMPFLLAGKERPFSRANAIATDGAGNTYVLDNLNQVILRIDSAGNSSVFAGTRNVRGSQDGVPGVGTLYTDATSRMAFDPQGNLIVADTCNGMIRRISPAGFISSLAGRPQNFCSATGTPAVGALDGVGAAAAFVRPSRIAIDASGTIMVASSSGRQLRRIDANRVVSTEDPFRAQTFSTISAMAFNQRGELFVAASGQSRIWRVDAGVGVVVAGTSGTRPAIPVDTPALSAVFNSIRALAFDKDGNLYIADSPTVRKLTTAGIVTSVAGSTANTVDGTGAGAFFSTVADLGVKSDGNLAVLQSDTSQLRTVTPAGVVTTSAATPYGREYADGKGAAARFSTGDYLAPAPDGSLYTLDAVNHVIRRIGADGTVSRAAGIAGT
ncbi:MAG TPA: hypothetical protein VFU95_05095, partial [Telluria sp.]|nr:hypothetical protein [Telluria sp.]